MKITKNLKKFTKLINWFAFCMAFPVILVAGRNLSMFIFVLLFITTNYKLLRINNKLTFVTFLFGIGSILSVINSNTLEGSSIIQSLQVLPNYIYWTIMVISLTNLNKIIHLEKISKYVMYGIVTLICYFVLLPYIRDSNIIIFNNLTLNSFSFLLICFIPPTIVYIFYHKRNKKIAIFIFLVCISILILEGRRSGTVLVLIPTLLALNFKQINISKLRNSLIYFSVILVIFSTSFTENIIKSSNDRIHNLIYESEDIFSTDISYLTRRLQVEKALIIFNKYPLTGIGLNKWANYRVNFVGDFEGSEYVINKRSMDEKSAHNSYMSLLGEGGLFLLIPFLLILLFNILEFIKKYNLRSQIENAYYWSFLGMIIHLYFISAIVNVYCWFIIGIVSMISIKYLKSNLNGITTNNKLNLC